MRDCRRYDRQRAVRVAVAAVIETRTAAVAAVAVPCTCGAASPSGDRHSQQCVAEA